MTDEDGSNANATCHPSGDNTCYPSAETFIQPSLYPMRLAEGGWKKHPDSWLLNGAALKLVRLHHATKRPARRE